MRKFCLGLAVALLAIGLGWSMAHAQTSTVVRTYTWTLVTGPGAALRWPNEANSASIFEANGGLLGRVVPTTATISGAGPYSWDLDTGTEDSACELMPSFPCAAGSPPVFLLKATVAEGPSVPAMSGQNSECNRTVTSCNTTTPGSADGGHPAGDTEGAYSYLVLHKEGAPTTLNKGIAFFTGSFTQTQSAYACNGCPPAGQGKDEENVSVGTNSRCIAAASPYACCTGAGTGTCTANIMCTGARVPLACCTGLQAGSCADIDLDRYALSNTTSDAIITPTDVSIWTSQATNGAGHSVLRLATGGAGAGQASICGNGVAFQTLESDLCLGNGLGAPPSVDFTIPNQKVTFYTYSTDMSQHASFALQENHGKCNPPDCYIEKIIIPAAIAQATALGTVARNVQVQTATSVLPNGAPLGLSNATVDSILFAWTSQALDLDGDSTEDRVDICPNDSTNKCASATATNNCPQSCPTGLVACGDTLGGCVCQNPVLCNQRLDVDQSCNVSGIDSSKVAGTFYPGGAGSIRLFGFASRRVGPFDP